MVAIHPLPLTLNKSYKLVVMPRDIIINNPLKFHTLSSVSHIMSKIPFYRLLPFHCETD